MNIIFDIETAPLQPKKHIKLTDNGETVDIGALSPITGKIIAIGIRHDTESFIFTGDEKQLLTKFWQKIKSIADNHKGYIKLIGFNVKQFDMHFLIVRSLTHTIPLFPLTRRQIIDLRDYLTFFHTYMKKGTLNDYAKLIGVDGKYNNIQNSDIPMFYEKGDIKSIIKYLEQDLIMTQELYNRCQKIGLFQFQ